MRIVHDLIDLMDLEWVERVEDKLVAKIIGMGWQHSIEYGDMHLFKKEINTYKVRLRVTCMSHNFAGIDSFVDSIFDDYNNFDKNIDIDRQCGNSDKEVIRSEIKYIIDECEKIIEEEKNKLIIQAANSNYNEFNQVWAVICKGKKTALNMLLDIASKRDAKIVKFSDKNNLYIVFDDGVKVTWAKRLNQYLIKNVNRLIGSHNIDDEVCENILLPLMCCVDGDNTELINKKEYCDFDIAILR